MRSSPSESSAGSTGGFSATGFSATGFSATGREDFREDSADIEEESEKSRREDGREDASDFASGATAPGATSAPYFCKGIYRYLQQN